MNRTRSTHELPKSVIVNKVYLDITDNNYIITLLHDSRIQGMAAWSKTDPTGGWAAVRLHALEAVFSEREAELLKLALDMSVSEGGWEWPEDITKEEIHALYKKLNPDLYKKITVILDDLPWKKSDDV